MRCASLLLTVVAVAMVSACPTSRVRPCNTDDECLNTESCTAGVCTVVTGEGEGEEGEGEGEEGEGEEGEGEEGEGEEGEGEEGEGEGEGEGEEGEGEGEGEKGECGVPIGAVAVAQSGEHCYASFATNDTWGQAVARCRELGGYLATPSSDEEEFVIEGLVSGTAHIGLIDIQGTFESFAGEPESFAARPFRAGEPAIAVGTSDRCLRINTAGGGGWERASCTAPATSTVCELPLPGGSGPPFCGDGIVQRGFGESCDGDCGAPACLEDGTFPIAATAGLTSMFIGFSSPRPPLPEALLDCVVLGGSLAEPADSTGNFFVDFLSSILQADDVALGYSDATLEAGNDPGAFRRLSNDAALGDGFQFFGFGEPDNGVTSTGLDEDCVVQQQGLTWADRSCTEPVAYICEIR